MVAQDGIVGSAAVARWMETLEDLHQRIGHRFSRSETRGRIRRYLVGLLGRVERKNGWQLAEAIGEHDPQGVQRLLNSAKRNADEVRDDRSYAVEHLGDEGSGTLIADETGFLKKGEKSVDVTRQYTGTAGDCQVGVSLAYASEKGTAFVDRMLYLPQGWTEDRDRRAEAGVPEGITFANKIELAERTLERAFEAQVPARRVVADSFYGRSHEFWKWLEERGWPYAVMVPKTNAVPLEGRTEKIERLVERLPEDVYSEVTLLEDTGERWPWQWACIALSGDADGGMCRWLLVRRDSEEPDDLGLYQAYGPEGTSVEELVGVCLRRWAIETAFEQAEEIGMDHYEVGKWAAWHRYITLCLLAHALLVVVRFAAREEEELRKRGAYRRTDPVHGAGGKAAGARHEGARRAKKLPARMAGIQTGAPGRGHMLQKGEPGRQTRPSRPRVIPGSQQTRDHRAAAGRSAAHRGGMGEGRATSAAAEVHWRTALPRSPNGPWRHPVGCPHGVIVAGDAPRIWQVGNGLPPLRAVGEPGLMAAHPPSPRGGDAAGAGDQGT